MNMKVGLLNTYSAKNLGDAALYSGISSLCPGGRAFVTGYDLSACSRVVGLEDASVCDAFVGVGGDIFNNPRKHLVTRQFLRNLAELLRNRKHTFVFGQSIPRSCDGLSFILLAAVFRQLAAVFVRDSESQHRLSKAGVNAVLSYDPAFALRPDDTYVAEARAIFEAMGVNPDRTAVMSIRTFDSLYPRDSHRALAEMCNLADALDRRGYQPVVLIQSDVSERDTDRALAMAMAQRCRRLRILDPFQHDMKISAWQVLMGMLTCSPIAVGIRYHTNVLRLAAGRMPFNLYYSNKGEDLTSSLGVPGVSIDAFNVAEHLPLIERTATATFDPAPIRRELSNHFSEGLEIVGAEPRRFEVHQHQMA